MKVIFKRLIIENFKGIKSFIIEFDEKGTKIIGENGTGKTTILDVLYWIFFGKNSLGKTKFDLLPLDENNEIIPKLYPHVELDFSVDGEMIKLSKIQKKSCEYMYNEIPIKAKDYTNKICELVDEKIFATLINPTFFGDNYSWNEQKKIILDNFDVEDTVIILDKYSKIKSEIINIGVADTLAKYEKKFKDLKTKIIKDKGTQEYLQSQLKDKEIDTDKESLNEQLITLKERLKELEITRDKLSPLEIQLTKIINQISTEETNFNNSTKSQKMNLEREIANKKSDKSNLLKEYKELNIKLKNISDKCTYCGAKLNVDNINQQKKDIKSDITEILVKGNKMVDDIKLLQSKLANVDDKYIINPELSEKKQKIEQDISECKANFNEQLYHEIKDKITIIDEKVSSYDTINKFQSDLKDTNESIKTATKESEKNEITIELIKQYNQDYSQLVADELNALLDHVKIKTFDVQKNGTIKETFEITMKGVPYKSLNSAGKIIAGVELIQLINKSLDIDFPIIIDNKESITRDFNIPNQLITLKVLKGYGLGVELGV